MKKCALLLLLPFAVLAKDPPQNQVSVQIASNDTRDVREHGGGLIGLAAGSKTTEVVFGVKAIISDQHVQLVCDEGHHQCSPLGEGKTYMGELKKDSVWITQTIPLTGKVVRDHYKIKGSW
ncbi:MAG: hypothetical protein WBQ59_09865 [Candidatus Acidiferrum sp.]